MFCYGLTNLISGTTNTFIYVECIKCAEIEGIYLMYKYQLVMIDGSLVEKRAKGVTN